MEHQIIAYEGPERIAPEWWREQPCEERDYYRVEDISGHRFWLFRAGDYGTAARPPDWFLHGAFG
jgi:protein ImuB